MHIKLTMQIPVVWEYFYESALVDYKKALKSYKRRHAKYQQEYAKWLAEQNSNMSNHENVAATEGSSQKQARAEPNPPKQPHIWMKAEEAKNFLNLSAALKIFLSPSVEVSKIRRVQDLLQEYLLGFCKVR